jgi:hypothetical protein
MIIAIIIFCGQLNEFLDRFCADIDQALAAARDVSALTKQ